MHGLGSFGKKRRFSLVWIHLPSRQLPKTKFRCRPLSSLLILKLSTVHVLHPIAFSFLPLNGYLIKKSLISQKISFYVLILIDQESVVEAQCPVQCQGLEKSKNPVEPCFFEKSYISVCTISERMYSKNESSCGIIRSQ